MSTFFIFKDGQTEKKIRRFKFDNPRRRFKEIDIIDKILPLHNLLDSESVLIFINIQR